jgi:hypothetical protein
MPCCLARPKQAVVRAARAAKKSKLRQLTNCSAQIIYRPLTWTFKRRLRQISQKSKNTVSAWMRNMNVFLAFELKSMQQKRIKESFFEED